MSAYQTKRVSRRGVMLGVSAAALASVAAFVVNSNPADAVDYPVRQYALLNHAPTAIDSRAQQRVAILPAAQAKQGLDLRTVRFVRSFGKTTTYAASSNSPYGPCLVTAYGDGSSGTSCPSATSPVTVTMQYGTAVGIVPDDVTEVWFSMTDGTRRTAAVTGNTWEAPPEARRVSWVQDGGVSDVDLMPLSSMPADTVIDENGIAGPR